MLYQFERSDGSVLTPIQVNEMLCVHFNISSNNKYYLNWYQNLLTMLAANIAFKSDSMNTNVLIDANELELDSLGKFADTFNKKSNNQSFVDKRKHYIDIFNILQSEFFLIKKK